ncbi:MAG TPA: phenylacetate--CoA ligase family protein [Beijerinckiaceae bacterium]|nr:phenylacetate--CoA ligase family protein [Beijerinckiaceae bacterium]
MTQYFDRQEIRAPRSRETALMRDLRAILAIAKPRAQALRRQIKGIDIASLKTRADLAQIPLLRVRDLVNLQDEDPPFGGFAAARLGALKRLIVSAGPRFEPEGHARDWWGAARGLCAAGFGRNDIVLNCFSYHLAAEGFVMESGASALGCAVIPAGPDDPELQLEVIHVLRPTAFCGRLDFLLSLVERARRRNMKIASIKRCLVADTHLSPRLRGELESEGLSLRQAYCVPHLGVVAYESDDHNGTLNEGLIVNEGLILEIVVPGTGEPVAAGEIGEIVVTRLNPDYPLLRFATGQLSALLPGMSPCGRTNLRLQGILGPVAQVEQVERARMTA